MMMETDGQMLMKKIVKQTQQIKVLNPNDLDGDGICDFIDTDDDGDGWSDVDENSCNTSSNDNNSSPSDYDGDSLCDFIDTDDDGDGLSDINETEIHETDPLNPDMDSDGLTEL